MGGTRSSSGRSKHKTIAHLPNVLVFLWCLFPRRNISGFPCLIIFFIFSSFGERLRLLKGVNTHGQPVAIVPDELVIDVLSVFRLNVDRHEVGAHFLCHGAL
jgi:hypothetical protein